METFLHSILSVCIILLLTATGYFCAAKGWMNREAKSFLSKFLMNIAVPAMCIYGLTNNLTHEMLAASGKMLLVPFLSCSAMFSLSYVTAKLLHLPRKSFGVFMMMASLSNSVFIGLAMCTELFGETCTPYVMLYYCISTMFTQLLGLSLVRWSGSGGERRSISAMLLGLLKTPAILAVIIGFALVLTGVRLPSLLVSYTRYMNNVVTPIALLVTGFIIHEIGLRELRIDRTQLLVMLFRFLINPAICIALCTLLGISGLGRSVFIVETAMPVVTLTVVASAEYGADEQMAAKGAALSTLACFIVIPVLMLII